MCSDQGNEHLLTNNQLLPIKEKTMARITPVSGSELQPYQNQQDMKKVIFITSCVLLMLFTCFVSYAQDKTEPFTVENYYKVKWGYAVEFINLWKINHYPLLKKAMEKGDIIRVEATKPILHSGEDTRWDFKVTIVFKDVVKAFDPNLTEPYKKQLYPDLEKLKKDEQHRFELLLAHWDVMTEPVTLQ
jgi:hypothetical protein